MNMPEMRSASDIWQRSTDSCEAVTLRNVLLLTDFSECSARALKYAIGIAGRYKVELHLFHCVDPTLFNLAEDPEVIQRTCDDARRELERLAGDLECQQPTRNLNVKVLVTSGDLPAILPQAVGELDLGLVIVGTHGRSGWRKLVLGSVAEVVIDRVSCPVLSVGPWANRSPLQEVGPRHILLAIKGSNLSQVAEAYAFSLARKYGSRLSIVDVLEDRAGRVVAEVSQFEWYEDALTNAAPDQTGTTSVRPLAEIGTRSDLILRVADQTAADLIVLAVPAKHRFTDRFVSTDSYRVVCGAPCPVLTVHAGPE